MRPRFTLRRSRTKGLPRADHALIARLEHEFSMDGCRWPDALCAKVLDKPPPHEREMLPGGYWLHLSQCWCKQTVDVTSVMDTHKRELRLHDPEKYKNYPTEWEPA